MSRTLNIVNGPSKFELMLGLFDWKPRREISFTLEGGLVIEARVDGVEAEDGSGESWNIKLGCELPEGLKDRAMYPEDRYHKLQMWYRTSERIGRLFFR